jgi:hypothetical protein
MDFAAYKAIPAVNWSSLKHMADSPAHYHYHLTHQRKDTDAMALGRAIHVAVLEPDEFPRRYTLWNPEGGNRNTTAYKTFAKSSEAAGLEVLLKPDYDKCLAVRDAVHAHDVAAGLLKGAAKEVTHQWTDTATGLACKSRTDAHVPNTLVDLKSTVTVDARLFGTHVARMQYHCQLAHYVAGLAAETDTDPSLWLVKIIAVEQEPPHDVAVFDVPDDALYAGEQIVAELLSRVRSCADSGIWPGRYDTEQTLELPGWAYRSDADAEDERRELEMMGLLPKGRTQ